MKREESFATGARPFQAAATHKLLPCTENRRSLLDFQNLLRPGSAALRWRSRTITVRHLFIALFATCILSTIFTARAENPDAAFDAANRLYDQGKYAEAATAFEQLLKTKISSPAIYFNLGNAFFKSGQIGRAIAAYRAAEIATPRDPDIRANLRFARNQVLGPTLASTPLENSLHKLTLNEWTLMLVVALWLLLLLLAFLQWRPNLWRNFRNLLIMLAAAFVFLGICVGIILNEASSSPRAIVITRDSVVHASPFEGSPNAFTLGDGAEVRILDERKDQNQDWVKVTTDPRRVGWLKRDQVLPAPTALQKSKTI